MEKSFDDIPPEIRKKLPVKKQNVILSALFEDKGDFYFAYLLYVLTFFGYIANTYFRDASAEIVFLARYFNPVYWIIVAGGWFPFVAALLINIYIGYSQKHTWYMYKKAFWLAIFMVITSWIWFAVINPMQNVFVTYFSSWEGYVTIVVMILFGFIAAKIGYIIRIFVFKKKKQEVDTLRELRDKKQF